MTQKEHNKDLPLIITPEHGPLYTVDMKHLVGSSGNNIDIPPVASLCRCGASENKPFCDGSHIKIKYVNIKEDDRALDSNREYSGKDMVVVFNLGVCSHSAICLRSLPNVFDTAKRPWINVDGGSVKDIIETIEKCPSGALSYKIGSRRYQDLDREPAIRIRPNGPFNVVGGIALKDVNKAEPESREHYCLCRCGTSKNKPFCDGNHGVNHFKG